MAKKNKSSEELAKVSKHDAIYHLIKDEKSKVNIIVGNYRVCQKLFDTFQQAEEYIGSKPYELIFTTCNVLINSILENEKAKQTSKTAEADK